VSRPDYLAISLSDAAASTESAARDAESAFGHLSAEQLNWKPDPQRWSIAQCLQHLITSNDMMLSKAQAALEGSSATLWQGLSPLSGLFGRLLISSQGPIVGRKYMTSKEATPASSGLPADIVRRFADREHQLASWMRGVREEEAARAIMASPFVRFITYSVFDCCRLIAAHDQRHLGQARRVMESIGFPAQARNRTVSRP
jgi:hypothetical protein